MRTLAFTTLVLFICCSLSHHSSDALHHRVLKRDLRLASSLTGTAHSSQQRRGFDRKDNKELTKEKLDDPELTEWVFQMAWTVDEVEKKYTSKGSGVTVEQGEDKDACAFLDLIDKASTAKKKGVGSVLLASFAIVSLNKEKTRAVVKQVVELPKKGDFEAKNLEGLKEFDVPLKFILQARIAAKIEKLTPDSPNFQEPTVVKTQGLTRDSNFWDEIFRLPLNEWEKHPLIAELRTAAREEDKQNAGDRHHLLKQAGIEKWLFALRRLIKRATAAALKKPKYTPPLIFISGAGPAGLVAAVLLAEAGRTFHLAEIRCEYSRQHIVDLHPKPYGAGEELLSGELRKARGDLPYGMASFGMEDVVKKLGLLHQDSPAFNLFFNPPDPNKHYHDFDDPTRTAGKEDHHRLFFGCVLSDLEKTLFLSLLIIKTDQSTISFPECKKSVPFQELQIKAAEEYDKSKPDEVKEWPMTKEVSSSRVAKFLIPELPEAQNKEHKGERVFIHAEGAGSFMRKQFLISKKKSAEVTIPDLELCVSEKKDEAPPKDDEVHIFWDDKIAPTFGMFVVQTTAVNEAEAQVECAEYKNALVFSAHRVPLLYATSELTFSKFARNRRLCLIEFTINSQRADEFLSVFPARAFRWPPHFDKISDPTTNLGLAFILSMLNSAIVSYPKYRLPALRANRLLEVKIWTTSYSMAIDPTTSRMIVGAKRKDTTDFHFLVGDAMRDSFTDFAMGVNDAARSAMHVVSLITDDKYLGFKAPLKDMCDQYEAVSGNFEYLLVKNIQARVNRKFSTDIAFDEPHRGGLVIDKKAKIFTFNKDRSGDVKPVDRSVTQFLGHTQSQLPALPEPDKFHPPFAKDYEFMTDVRHSLLHMYFYGVNTPRHELDVLLDQSGLVAVETGGHGTCLQTSIGDQIELVEAIKGDKYTYPGDKSVSDDNDLATKARRIKMVRNRIMAALETQAVCDHWSTYFSSTQHKQEENRGCSGVFANTDPGKVWNCKEEADRKLLAAWFQKHYSADDSQLDTGSWHTCFNTDAVIKLLGYALNARIIVYTFGDTLLTVQEYGPTDTDTTYRIWNSQNFHFKSLRPKNKLKTGTELVGELAKEESVYKRLCGKPEEARSKLLWTFFEAPFFSCPPATCKQWGEDEEVKEKCRRKGEDKRLCALPHCQDECCLAQDIEVCEHYQCVLTEGKVGSANKKVCNIKQECEETCCDITCKQYFTLRHACVDRKSGVDETKCEGACAQKCCD